MMKILLIGAKGQLGSQIMHIIKNGKSELGSIPAEVLNAEIIETDVDTLDITNLQMVKESVKTNMPDVVINCAAFTNVDGCESNKDLAFKVNSLGARNIAIACEEIGSKLIHVSTDYVFSGVGETPLKESDLVAPVSVYGKTKLLGEEFVRDFSSKYYIVRTSWLYGYVGHNFVYTMMKLGKDRDSLSVVNDQLGNPTHANDLAYHILKLIETEEYGVYHCTGKGECSWYDFASEIMKLSGRNCTVNPCTSSEYKAMYPNSADRPAYSSLDNMMLRCTVGDEMRDWKDAIKTFMDNVEK